MRLKSLILSNNILYLLFSLLGLYGCGLFTFSGASLPDHIQTFSIQVHTEVADGPLSMPVELTQALETKISGATHLTKEEKDGDLQYDVTIKSFSYLTTFSTKNEDDNSLKEVQRLTITIEATCLCPADQAFEQEYLREKKQFSASADMLSTENKLEKEPKLIKEIFLQLVDNIYNTSIDNW